jgi:two-component system, LytTR family, sensor kinase
MSGKSTKDGLWATISVQVAVLLFWSLLKLVTFLIKFSNSHGIEYILKSQTIILASAIAVVILLSVFFSHYNKTDHHHTLKIFIICFATLIAILMWTLIERFLEIKFGVSTYNGSFPLRYYFIRSMLNMFTMATMSVIFYFMRYLRELRIQKEKTLKAETLAREAELQMLRYQLNPHFLFNALNSIRSLIEEDKKLAWMMLTELSEFLRYSLISNEKKEVPLGREIDAIRNYFKIQAIRFEDNLTTTIQASNESEEILIPSFLVHPLVENAVKYGMQTSPRPLKIILNAEIKKDNLIITVTNTGHLISRVEYNPDGTGTGLKNICRRLEVLHNGSHSFDIFESDGLVTARIIVKHIKRYSADD